MKIGDNTLDLIDYQLFLLLRENPLYSINELSKKLGVSFHTVRNKIKNMKYLGFLRPDSEINDPLLGPRKRTEVEALYKPHKLGLKRIHVLLMGIKDTSSLSKLLKLAETHPYTHFRAIAFSPSPSLYYQFDTPPETINYYTELLEILINKGLFKKYWIIRTEESSRSVMKLEYWNQQEHSWEINNSELTTNDFEDFWSKVNNESSLIPLTDFVVPTFTTPKLDKLDLYLLRELSINAKVSQKELAQYYKKDNTTISKRLKKFQKNEDLIAILYFNRKVFNITDNIIIKASIRNAFKEAFHNFITKYFPFTSTVVTDGSELIWYVSYPSGMLSEILGFIWNKMKNVQLFHLGLKKSRTYYFYPLNYDVNNKSWKTSYEYVVSEPLEMINNY